MTARAEIKGRISMESNVAVQLKRDEMAAENFTNRMKGFARAAGAAFTVGAVANWASGIMQWANGVTTVAENLGDLPVEDLLAVQRAFSRNNVEVEQTNALLGKLQNLQQEVADGNEKVAQKFDRFGISAEKVTSLGLPELLAEIGNGLDGMVRPGAVISDLFGEKLGTKAVSTLKSLHAELGPLRAEMEKYAASVEQASRAQDNLDEAKANIQLSGGKVLGGIMDTASFAAKIYEQFDVLMERGNFIEMWDAINKAASEAFGGDREEQKLQKQMEAIRRAADAKAEQFRSDQIDDQLAAEELFFESTSKAGRYASTPRAPSRSEIMMQQLPPKRERGLQITPQAFATPIGDRFADIGAGGSGTVAAMLAVSAAQKTNQLLEAIREAAEQTATNTRGNLYGAGE